MAFNLLSLFPKVLTIFLYCYTSAIVIFYVLYNNVIIPIIIIIILLIALYTYLLVIYVGPGSPLDHKPLIIKNLANAEIGLEEPPSFMTLKNYTLKSDGRLRLCRSCYVWKPDRTHHCSNCNRCFLRMDHHCPWFASCIGFKNQKFFIQFLEYTTFYSIIICAITSNFLYHWFKQESYENEDINLQIVFVWLLAIVTSISMIAFTWYSIYLVVNNMTVIESSALREHREELEILHDSGHPDPMLASRAVNIFDLGSKRRNWDSVMGSTWMEWLFPIATYRQRSSVANGSYDDQGLYFPVNKKLKRDIQLQNRLLTRLTPRSSMDV